MHTNLSYENKDSIHIFIWKKSTRHVVDAFIKQLDDIMERDGVMHYILVDFVESGLPPARYLVKAMSQWQQRQKRIEQTSLAIVYQSASAQSMILHALAPAVTRKRESTICYFSEDEREAALAWLQEEKAKANC